MTKQIQLDPGSPIPLYLQIAERVRRLIAIGALRTGDRIPTVRELAVQTRVNRNTAARAIQHLEGAGVVHTRVGQGTFVADGAEAAGRERAEAAIDAGLDRVIVDAKAAGFPLSELGPRLARRVSRFESRLPGDGGGAAKEEGS